MEDHEQVKTITPVYAGMINPAALGTDQVHGFVLVTTDTVYSIRFDSDDQTWDIIWRSQIGDRHTEDLLRTGFEKLRAEFDLETGFGPKPTDNDM